MKATIYIGIDPDVTASGVCEWNAGRKHIVSLECLPFFGERDEQRGVFDLLKSWASSPMIADVHIIIDAGWLNKTNFHSRANESHKANAIIGERTGANHETGKKIAEMCEYLGLSYELHRPTTSKIRADYFKRLTGVTGRTNQEMRDAAMLVFGL
jgi:hypothetical protein